MWDEKSNVYKKPIEISKLALNIKNEIHILGIITKIENNGWKMMNKKLRQKALLGEKKNIS